MNGEDFLELAEQNLYEPAAMLIPRFILANALFYLGLAIGMHIGG